MTAEFPHFFLSYARMHFGDDPDLLTRKFFKDLCTDVSQLAATDQPGYMDQRHLEIGADWQSRLTLALSTCRVFVPIYSPRYFTSDYCGREWALFDHRIARHAQSNGARPEVVVPVLWTEMEADDLPDLAKSVQYSQQGMPAAYLREGLYGIMKLKRYGEEYKETVLLLAKAIIRAARNPLDPLGETDRIPLQEAHNAFAGMQQPRESLTIRVTVAACDLESLPPGRDPSFYAERPLGWNPYVPTDAGPVAQHAEEVIRSLGHRPEVRQLNGDRPDAAAPDVLLVDLWAADVDALAHDLRGANSPSSVVVLPVGQHDPQTLQHRERLESALKSSIRPSLSRSGSRRGVDRDEFDLAIGDAVEAAIGHHVRTVRVENAPPPQKRLSLRDTRPGDPESGPGRRRQGQKEE